MPHARRSLAIAMALGASLTGNASSQLGPVAPVDMTLLPYASTAQSVTLPDGRALHLVCMGEGSPTVILSAGLGDWSGTAWSHIQPEIAKTTRVCAWDRPGFGLSDGMGSKETVATNAADLEAALSRAAIPGPYVMVSHSLGSYETLLFTDRNRARVAGMVLVDPSYLDMTARAQRIMDRFHYVPPPPPGGLPGDRWRKCADELRNGTLTASSPDPDACLNFPAFFPRPVRAALKAKLTGDAAQFATAAAFYADAAAEGSRMVIDPARTYGDMPLLVLSSTEEPAGAPPLDPALVAASGAERDHAYAELAAFSTNGKAIKVPGAGHYIQRDRPDVVVDAVRSVIAEARARKTG